MEIKVLANAKINLTLDVLSRREDGYHTIESVMQSVDLSDRILVRKTGVAGEITVACGGGAPEGQENLAHRAAVRFYQSAGLQNPGVFIRIDKRIPMEAGLAGGSADAAAVLHALNRLENTCFSTGQLCQIGAGLGADVPFCVAGGTLLAQGIGTDFTPLPPLPDCFVVIAKPRRGVSTALAYAAVDQAPPARRLYSPAAIAALRAGVFGPVAQAVGNRFEEVLALEETAIIKRTMLEMGAAGACMTGSGTAVFSLFDAADAADACVRALRTQYARSFLCRPVREGCRFLDEE